VNALRRQFASGKPSRIRPRGTQRSARAEGSKAVMEQGSFSWRTDGYNKVFDYKAGKADWQQANLQTETG